MLVFQRSGNVYAANNDGVFGPVCDSRDSLVAPGVPGVWGKEEAEVVCRFCHEGSRQKLPKGFFPLRGGGITGQNGVHLVREISPWSSKVLCIGLVKT